ncbi:MAG: hypothetical protein ABIO70_28515 [Pseudomonadota bacterium]
MHTRLLFALAVLGLTACFKASGEYADTGWYGAAPEGDVDADGDADDDWGSEQESDFLMLPPAATDKYVFIANPDRGTLTRVSVPHLDVITVEVGEQPAVVVTTSDYTKAVSFNAGSDDLSVVDAATLSEARVPVRQNLNAMELSPDGRWAVCYHDADVEDDEYDDEGGAQSFNEISVVDTDSLEVFSMVVGAGPRQVKFDASSSLAIVVSDQYLAMIDLTAAQPAPTMVQLAEDLLDPPKAEELEIAPSGAFAFVRQYGANDVAVVDLSTFALTRVHVGFNPTDLDITPDGSKAVVVTRGDRQLWLLDCADPYADAEVVPLPEDYVLGSLSMTPDGGLGVLYSTAVIQSRYATWDVASGEVTLHSLVKPIDTLSVSPTGETLLIFHTEEDGPSDDPESAFAGSWALSMISLADFRQNSLKLEAEPLEYANSLDGLHGYFVQDGIDSLVRLDYDTLLYDTFDLKSQPEHVGVLPDTPYAWVSQEHELGRISFYDADDSSIETITGFELNGEIEH